MKTSLAILTLLLCRPALSQPASTVHGTFVAPPTDEDPQSQSPEGKDEPSARLYKDGYHLILDEEWDSALRKLNEVLSRYPKSPYVDDAKYWSAYALKHTDRDRARTAYKKFIKEYPKSKYVDDAVADLSELEAAPTVYVTGVGDSNMVVTPLPGGYAYGTGTSMHLANEQMKRAEHQLRRQLEHLGRPLVPMALPHRLRMLGVPRPDHEDPEDPENAEEAEYANDAHLDKETKIKMKALYALGETRVDEKAFQALKDVALDMHEARPLREASLDALSQFKRFDVLPVYLDIAKRDTSEDLQNYAIDYIGQHGKDKGKTVQTLIDLFRTLPNDRTEQRKTIFYSIADIGNDRAIDFLASVAKTSENYQLRTEAIYYLGAIGGEKARAALYDIIRGKKEK